MYLEKKKIGSDIYNYLKMSVRYKEKVKTKTIAYLGKGKMAKSDLKSAISKYKQRAEKIKTETLNELKLETNERALVFLSLEQISKVEELKKNFKEKVRTLDARTKTDMFDDFITFYAYNTNAIEGNTFTLRDTDLLLNKGITPKGKTLREINDHLNAKEAFNFFLKVLPKMNHDTIIEIHSMLMKNIDIRVGSYRTQNVRVFGATFESSPVEYVKIDMGLLLKWYRKNKARIHPLMLAAVFHHKFEKIHPFFDGNGRTGRMLANAILLQNHFPPVIVADAQRKRDYSALASADNADLNKLQIEHREIIRFFYFSLLKTYNTIFRKWG